MQQILQWLLEFCGILPRKQPENRNEVIRVRFNAGEALSALAAEFGVSLQRIFQIVHGKNH